MPLRWMLRRKKRREYETRMAEVTRLLEQKDFSAAERLCEEALGLAKEVFGEDHPDVVTPLYVLGASRLAQAQPDRALDPCNKAIAIAEQAAIPTEPRLPRLLGLLTAILEQSGNVDGAMAVLRRMLEGYDKMRAPDSREVEQTLRSLGILLLRQGNPAEAEPLFERAISLRAQPDGGNDLSMAELYYNLATCFTARHKLVEAEAMLDKAAGLAEKAGAPDPRLVASILHNRAVVAEKRGALPEAGKLYEQALDEWGKVHPKDHADLRPTLLRLAQVRKDEGRPREAERVYRRVLMAYEEDPGRDRAALITCYGHLASLCFSLRRYADAEAYGKQALKWTDKGAPLEREPHVPALNLAEIYRAEERYDEAEPLYRRALGEAEAARHVAARDFEPILNGLAATLRALSREAEAGEVEARSRRRAGSTGVD